MINVKRSNVRYKGFLYGGILVGLIVVLMAGLICSSARLIFRVQAVIDILLGREVENGKRGILLFGSHAFRNA